MQTDCVVNLTNYPLTQTQIEILSLNTKFCLAEKTTPMIDIIVAIEALNLPQENATDWKLECHNELKINRTPPQNLTPLQLHAIGDLKKQKQILILTADKGNVTVLMYKKDYEQKMNNLLSGAEYEKITNTNFKTDQETHVTKTIQRMRKAFPLATDELKLMLPITPTRTPHMYGSPKTHKIDIPMRPIVSSIDSLTRNIEKYLKTILQPLTKNSNFNLTNSYQALEIIKDAPVDQNTRMCSFDVKNMFTSIPRDELYTVLKTRLENDTTLFSRTNLDPEQIVDLVKLTLDNTYFQFGDSLYKQKIGLPMGSPISPPLADIFMEDRLQRATESHANNPFVLKKYVDDILCLYDCTKTNPEQYLTHLNSCDPHIQFTLEKEKDNQLPYLDILITRQNHSLHTAVYRKPTDKGILLNFKSNHPYSTKAAVVRSGLTRAHLYCKNNELTNEITKVYKILQKNDYPNHFINKIHQKVKIYIAKKAQAPAPPQPNDQNQPMNAAPNTDNTITHTLTLPYMQGQSEILHKITKKHFPSIRVTYKSKNTLRSQLTHVKPKSDISLKNVIYKISCQDCDGIYIGETLRNAQTRVKEHKAKLKHMQDEQDNNHNKIALHAQKYNHDINFVGTEILAHESNYRKRKTKEAVAMLSHNNTFSKPSATINPIWLPLIKEHGKTYFKVKSQLPQTAPYTKKTRAAATQPFNNQQPPISPISPTTHGGRAASAAKVNAPSHTYSLRPRQPHAAAST